MAPQPLIVECALLGVIWTFVAAQLQLYTRGNERKWHPPRALLVIPDLDQLLARFGGDLASLLASIRISLVRVGSTERLSVCGPFKREIFTLADWRRQDVYSDMAHLFDAAAAKGIPDTCHALLFHPTREKEPSGTVMQKVVLKNRSKLFVLRLEAAGQILQLLQEPILLMSAKRYREKRAREKRAREANADGTLDDAQPRSRQRTDSATTTTSASATTTTTSSPPPPHSTAQGESDDLFAPCEGSDPDAAATTSSSSSSSPPHSTAQGESGDLFAPCEGSDPDAAATSTTTSSSSTTTSQPVSDESDELGAPCEENDPDAAATSTTTSSSSPSSTTSQLESDDPFTAEENASIRALLAELFPGLSPDKPDE